MSSYEEEKWVMMSNRSLFRRLRRLESEITPPTRGRQNLTRVASLYTAPAAPEAPTHTEHLSPFVGIQAWGGVKEKFREPGSQQPCVCMYPVQAVTAVAASPTSCGRRRSVQYPYLSAEAATLCQRFWFSLGFLTVLLLVQPCRKLLLVKAAAVSQTSKAKPCPRTD